LAKKTGIKESTVFILVVFYFLLLFISSAGFQPGLPNPDITDDPQITWVSDDIIHPVDSQATVPPDTNKTQKPKVIHTDETGDGAQQNKGSQQPDEDDKITKPSQGETGTEIETTTPEPPGEPRPPQIPPEPDPKNELDFSMPTVSSRGDSSSPVRPITVKPIPDQDEVVEIDNEEDIQEIPVTPPVTVDKLITPPIEKKTDPNEKPDDLIARISQRLGFPIKRASLEAGEKVGKVEMDFLNKIPRILPRYIKENKFPRSLPVKIFLEDKFVIIWLRDKNVGLIMELKMDLANDAILYIQPKEQERKPAFKTERDVLIIILNLMRKKFL